jgi:MFS superfamily sulfate permease-like transporter
VIISAEPITDIDTTAAETLIEVCDELDARGIRLAFAELKGPPKDRLERYGLYDRVGDDYFFPTLGRAINAYLDDAGIDWVDWSDR